MNEKYLCGSKSISILQNLIWFDLAIVFYNLFLIEMVFLFNFLSDYIDLGLKSIFTFQFFSRNTYFFLSVSHLLYILYQKFLKILFHFSLKKIFLDLFLSSNYLKYFFQVVLALGSKAYDHASIWKWFRMYIFLRMDLHVMNI